MDPRPSLALALDQIERLAHRIEPALLDHPTPCTEFDLRTLIGHVVGAVHRIAYIGEGGYFLDVAPATGPIEDTGWPAAVARAKHRAVTAWADDAKLQQQVEVPWGKVPGFAAVGGYVMEVTTHTWDLAQVLDPGAALDPGLAEQALAIATEVLPADIRSDESLPFGPVQPAPAGADPYTRLAAWMGRSTTWNTPA
ncbi:TIGR03086 family metal-binding protein [Actinocorallia lasiicapitis]